VGRYFNWRIYLTNSGVGYPMHCHRLQRRINNTDDEYLGARVHGWVNGAILFTIPLDINDDRR